ncbi:MAG TPA: hypothetical protein VMW25_05470 [Clostridia bacterium]|nr:hypothetical protein [Clostridia bacterium]
MAKPFKGNTDKRVIFPQSKQQEFLKRVASVSKLPWRLIAEKIGVNKRTLFDWRREKYSISLGSLKKLCDIANLVFPNNVEIREPFWSVQKASKIGGKATYRKYGRIGNPKVRKEKWQEWWEKSGKHNPNKWFVARKVASPKKSTELAEFVGIMLGDGGITKRQITVTLDDVRDREYVLYVKGLMKKLFKIEPRISKRKNESSATLKISRTNLVIFCKSIGLLVGNKIKQNLDIPDWVKEKKEYLIPCVRGLMDTDGCIFLECHSVKEKKYCYPRLSLVTASPSLRFSVYETLEKLGFSPKIRNNRSVQIEKSEKIKKYFNEIGSSNIKHINRFKEFFEGADDDGILS